MPDYFSEEILGQKPPKNYFAEEVLKRPVAGQERVVDWFWNLARDVPGVAASLPAAAMQGTPMGNIGGLLSKGADVAGIDRAIEKLPGMAWLKKLEEKVFGPGKLHRPEIMPETTVGQIKRTVQTITGAPTRGEGVMRLLEQQPGIGVIPRTIRDPESWYRRPLPNIMDVALLMGGVEAGFGRFAPKTLEAPRVDTPAASLKSIQKVVDALKEAKPKRAEQEAIFTKERGERLGKGLAVEEAVGGGEIGFKAKTGAMAGELTKVEFEGIRKKVSQGDIDNIFNEIKNSPMLSEWERLPAGKGLGKIFGEHGGKVPTEGEILLLNRALGSEFTKAVLRKRGLWKKAKEAGWQLANVPRSIMASFDLSAPFRQGIFMIYRPKTFFKQFGDMVKSFGSEKAYRAVQESIAKDTRLTTPKKTHLETVRESGLAITELERSLFTREEAFMSNWAEKIPGVGRGVRASARAHTSFLNKLRHDNFVDLMLKAEKAGIPRTADFAKSLADFINNATGRGSLGGLQKAATTLNTFFFSPRLMASRLRLLNPVYYAKLPKFVRKEAIKALMAYTGSVSTVLGLAKMAGAEVGLNPTDANFGKIIIGKTRIDVMGGFQQYIRAAAQFLGGRYTSSITGKRVTLGEGYKPISRLDILTRQIESKQSPAISFVTDILKQQDWKGEPISVPKELGRRLVPMVISDMIELARDDPKLLPLTIPAMLGVGLQTYEMYPPKAREFFGFLSDAEDIARVQKKLPTEYQAGFAAENRGLLGAVSSLRSISRNIYQLRKQIEEIEKSDLPLVVKRSRIRGIENQMEILAGMGLRLRQTPTER